MGVGGTRVSGYALCISTVLRTVCRAIHSCSPQQSSGRIAFVGRSYHATLQHGNGARTAVLHCIGQGHLRFHFPHRKVLDGKLLNNPDVAPCEGDEVALLHGAGGVHLVL